MNLKKYSKGITLFTILLFPSLLYIVLSSGKHNMLQLKYYGPRDVNRYTKDGKEMVDTIHHTIPDFSFVNQNGETITQETTKGKIYVADFFFTTCGSICPKMSSQLAVVQEKLKEMNDVLILSHTVNPENDSVEVLKAYAKEYGALDGRWHLLTGDKKELYDIARNGYMVNALEGDGGPDDFIHSEKFILVDKNRNVRGIYDGTDTKDVLRLVDEIKVLRASEFIPKKDK